MPELYDGLILYHGSYCEVPTPLLDKCAARKDFGRGFYLTTSRDQAISFLRTSIIKAANKGDADRNQQYGFLSEFRVQKSEHLKIYSFQTADTDWLHCVAAHRKRNSFIEMEKKMAEYDVIIGKIADDQTNAVLTAYISGVFGRMGEPETDAFCIRQLYPDKLKDQFCFKTEAAIASLHFVKGEQVWIQK